MKSIAGPDDCASRAAWADSLGWRFGVVCPSLLLAVAGMQAGFDLRDLGLDTVQFREQDPKGCNIPA